MRKGKRTSSPSQDNALAATQILLDLLGVPVTETTLVQSLKGHYAYPSLASITDTLEDLGVDCMAVKISPSQLHEAGFPCMAWLAADNGSFVVVTGIKDNNITYIAPSRGEVREPMDQFVKNWNGAALLVEKGEHAGEKSYAKKRRIELLDKRRIPIAATAVLALAALSAAMVWSSAGSGIFSLILGLKSAGLALSVLLLMHYFTSDSPLMQRLCPAGQKLNCKGILHTPAAKLFGLIPMADLGALYFSGGILALLFTGFSGSMETTLNLLTLLSLLTLPYTAFSIFYQAFVARQWCWICVAIQAIFWTEFVSLSMSGNLRVPDIRMTDALPVLWAFVLPAAVWLAVRPAIDNSTKAQALLLQLLRLKTNPSLFRHLLNSSPAANMGERLPVELGEGDPSAPLAITVVSHPQCPVCSLTHDFLEDMQQQFSGTFRYNIRFFCPAKDTGSDLAKGVLKLALQGEQEKAMHALKAAYKLKGSAAIEKWKEEYSTNPDNSTANELLSYHTAWAASLNIKGTPAFFINGRPLPDGFTIYDIRPVLKTKYRELQQGVEV